MGKLTAVSVRSGWSRRASPRAHADGSNLYLFVTGPGAAKWTFRYMRAGKAREMGLGSVGRHGPRPRPAAAAQEARKRLRDGRGPHRAQSSRAKRSERAAAGVNTFREVADLYIRSHKAGWKNAKHAAQWPSSLEAYAHPVLGDLPVADVDTGAVMRVLEPIWAREGRDSLPAARPYRIVPRITPRRAAGGTAKIRHGGGAMSPICCPTGQRLQPVEHHAALPSGERSGPSSRPWRTQDGLEY